MEVTVFFFKKLIVEKEMGCGLLLLIVTGISEFYFSEVHIILAKKSKTLWIHFVVW